MALFNPLKDILPSRYRGERRSFHYVYLMCKTDCPSVLVSVFSHRHSHSLQYDKNLANSSKSQLTVIRKIEPITSTVVQSLTGSILRWPDILMVQREPNFQLSKYSVPGNTREHTQRNFAPSAYLDCSEEFRERNFASSFYRNFTNNRNYPMYEMTRDGFTFLVITCKTQQGNDRSP